MNSGRRTNEAAYSDVVSVYAALVWGESWEGRPRGHGDYFASPLNFEADQK
ncbi:hypothetical protein ACFVXC_14110 [Streptomyces sp. NPDC058257]|uniref:hypothetical protein n=1 Tax=Streptomyces sp. NPDC058257 TaxID=3346409 RepID=UPI0036EEDEC4